MKTNHQRQFKAVGGFALRVRYDSQTKKLPIGLGSVGASYGGDAVNGHRGEAKVKRGAKKYLRNQVRKTAFVHIRDSSEA
jgi:hypothetical protein